MKHCVVPETMEVHWKFQRQFIRGSMKLNWKFKGGGQSSNEKPFIGEAWISSGATHHKFSINLLALNQMLFPDWLCHPLPVL